MRKAILSLFTLAAITVPAVPAFAASTPVPGHGRYDTDGNGSPDVGAVVNGKYTSLYAYDASGAYYWDLGDGRIQTSSGITSVEDLDQATLSTCDYVVTYRGTFDNDPFLDSGVIANHIVCSGFDGTSTYNYVIVHETDPRYTGNPDNAIWGNWEYAVNTESGVGNTARKAAMGPRTP